MRPIGVIRSCFSQKFGIPRQAGLVPAATAVLELDPAVLGPEALRGLDTFSHVWVLFLFHVAHRERTVVRAPRLGGSRKVGVLATRSPHRPNRIGMSAVRLLRVEEGRIHVAGGDFLDGSPLLDVKPYLAWADAVPDASSGWAAGALPRLPVRFGDAARAALAELAPGLEDVLVQSLALDPRRAGARAGEYVMRVGDVDARCRLTDGAWEVEALVRVVEGRP